MEEKMSKLQPLTGERHFLTVRRGDEVRFVDYNDPSQALPVADGQEVHFAQDVLFRGEHGFIVELCRTGKVSDDDEIIFSNGRPRFIHWLAENQEGWLMPSKT